MVGATRGAGPVGGRVRLVALLLAGVVLASFVSPFSYLPNPPGLYWLLVGGYRYDPHSPFVNRFATLGTPDATPFLAAKLDRLLGQTGLDPLDPARPLLGYRILEIGTGRPGWDAEHAAEVRIEFRYAGGDARTYRVPVWQYGARYDGSGTTGWRYSGLDPLFAEHLALPDLPLATADTALRLGSPRPVASLLADGSTPLDGRFGPSPELVRLRWSPDGRHAFVHPGEPGTGGPLWLTALDGAPARAVTAHAQAAAWGADGRLVYLRCADRCGFGARFDLVVADPAGGARTLGQVPGRTLALAGGAAYTLADGALWRTSLDGGAAARLAAFPDAVEAFAPALTPDASRFVYGCGGDVCLAAPDGTAPARVALGYPVLGPAPGVAKGLTPPAPAPTRDPTVVARTSPLASLGLAWSPDGGRVAIATGVDPVGGRGPEFWIVDRAGRILHRGPLGPDGTTGEPVWAPDGRTIILTTYPRGGRRIVAIDAATGQVTDLSQPRWDTFAALAPDGTQLLLWNGRGTLWLAPLERHPRRGRRCGGGRSRRGGPGT